MNLPKFRNSDPAFQLLQDKWASILNPVISLPMSSANTLMEIPIATGTNVINHLLGRRQQGWIISDQDASATMYRSQPFNDKTLTLVSTGPCVINLLVF